MAPSADAPHAGAEARTGDVMPIAVVGIGFRGPGDATSVEGFWNMISEAREAWSPVPKEKWNNDAFYHPDSNRNGTSNVKGGHYFAEDLARFDAPFFGMTNTEAEALDPQQRLLLECCYEALENSGTPLDKAVGSDTSVFVGSFCGDYTDMLMRDPENVPLYQATSSGHSRAIIANRLSYFFDFKGPSVTIDTACSASLVALHLACQSLRTGETRQAVVAGANVILSHEMTISMSMMRFLSPDGRCYTFDERANGYARGEGVGCLYLKPLDAALKDGDTIRGIIRNTGVNQDGKTSGITLPSGRAQEELMESVYRKAGLDPVETTYVECHGTGTPAGDPLETGAIAKLFGPGRSPERPLRIGSVKTNVGHLEGASGVAGVIKTILMLENGVILPNRNFEKPNKQIPLEDWKLKVTTKTEPWETQTARRASINSFGYGGTNAHAVVEETGAYLASRGLKGNYMRTFRSLRPDESHQLNGSRNGNVQVNGANGVNGVKDAEPIANGHVNGEVTNGSASVATNGNTHEHSNGTNGHHIHKTPISRLFLLSAFDQEAGKRQAHNLSTYIKGRKAEDEDQFLSRLAYTLSDRRSRFAWKAAVDAKSCNELTSKLTDLGLKFTKSAATSALAFIFTGQGAQWAAMGRELIDAYPLYKETLVRASNHLKSIGCSWDLIEELCKDASESQINLAYLSQPLCSAIQIALVELLAAWNIRPTAVTGHSSGEIAAAYAAGALSLEDAMAVAYHRGVSSSRMKDLSTVTGSMMAVGSSKEDAASLIDGLTQGKAVVACVNSPSSITVSGDLPAIEELEQIAKEKGIFARKLAVEVAYHSHHMALVAEDYRAAINNITVLPSRSNVQFFSSVTGTKAEISTLGPDYWVENMVGQVKFADSLLQLCLQTSTGKKSRRRGPVSSIDAIVEVGPHSALSGPIKQIIQADSKLSTSPIPYHSALLRKSSAVDTVLTLASKLLTGGYPVDLNACNGTVSQDAQCALSDLPPYSWNHGNSYWAESRASKALRTREFARTDLLGAPDGSPNALEPRWRNVIRSAEIPWVNDHKVQGNAVYPAAGYLVMAIEAAHQRATKRGVRIKGYRLREVNIGQALVIPESSGEVETVVQLRPYLEGTRVVSDIWDEFCVYSISTDDRWTEHCRGLVSVQKQPGANEVSGEAYSLSDSKELTTMIDSLESSCVDQIDVAELYKNLDELGLEYGPTFANVTSARVAPNRCISDLKISDTASTMPMGFQYPFIVHPATVDSSFHGLFAALAAESGPLKNPLLPVFVQDLQISANITAEPGRALKVFTSTERKDGRQINATITVMDTESTERDPIIKLEGLTCTTLAHDSQSSTEENKQNYAFNLHWKPDVDLLTANDVAGICADIKPLPEELDAVRAQEEAAFYLMDRTLAKIDSSEVKDMHDYHQLLWECMKVFVAKVKDETLGIPTTAWKEASEATKEEVINKVTARGAEGNLMCHVGRNLPAILRKNVEALAVMIEDGRLDGYYRDNARFDRNYQAAAKYIDLLGHKNPHLRVLEVGSGTGGATLPLLEALGGANEDLPRFSKWEFTDISSGFFDAAKEKLTTWNDLINYSKLDIEADPTTQGFEGGSYDVVVAANVLHATKSMHNTMTNVRKLLKPGGKLILIELTRERGTTSTIFGTLPGWWAGANDGRTKGPTLLEEEWVGVLQDTGFSGVEAAVWDSPTEPEHQGSMIVSRAVETSASPETTPVLVIDNGEFPASQLDKLKDRLVESSSSVEVVPLLSADPVGKVCVVLCEATTPFLSQPSEEQLQAAIKLFTNASGVIWVTRGAQIGSSDPDSNLVTGFARTVRSEYGSSKVLILDLDPNVPLEDPTTTGDILQLFKGVFTSGRDNSNLADVEFCQRDGHLKIARVCEDKLTDKNVLSAVSKPVPELQPFVQPGRPLVIETGTPGLLDSIHFIDDVRMQQPLPASHVEIEVKATGFNFKDVMMAMGQIEVETLGLECGGVVSKIGSSVTNVAVGDRVACFEFGAFANYIRAEAIAVQKLPDHMSFETAACLPVIYSTAYYSVYHAGNVRKGETVLIHAASGGLGQATIELCQMVGAEIYATVGTVEKKKLLMEQFGIPEDHIFSSRDTGFAKEVMRMTQGEGIDVIMNSVAGEMLRVTWECIAPFGRFIELGARDYTINTRLEMSKFARNVTFSVVNLVSLVRERPKIAAKVWEDVMDLFRQSLVQGPRPVTVYGYSEIEKAMRTMQSGKHMGKLVAVPREGEMVKAIPRDLSANLFSSEASYLLVGGLGGLGRATALWMIECGAKHLIFASRSGLKKQEARDVVDLLQTKGATVSVHACDISDESQFKGLLEQVTHLPAIKGVIQGAMVLQDAMLDKMTLVDYNAAIRPKVQGTWNLHNMLPKDMDFFVMLSSTSGVIGNASQANYAAGGTFMDAFANFRVTQGLPATTLDLGVILGVGYVAENEELAKGLERQGFQGTTEQELMALIQSAIANSRRTPAPLAQTITGLGSWSEGSLGAFEAPMFSHFRRLALKSSAASGSDGDSKMRIRDTLREVKSLQEAVEKVCAAVIAKVSSLSMIPVEDISENRPITEYGMDSLVAVEMRNWLFKEMDATIPILELLANQNLLVLAEKITKRSKLVDTAAMAKGDDKAA